METVFWASEVGSTGRWRTYRAETGWHLLMMIPMSSEVDCLSHTYRDYWNGAAVLN